MASVLGWVTQETDSETKSSVQEVYQGVLSGTKPERGAAKRAGQRRGALERASAATAAAAPPRGLGILSGPDPRCGG